MNFTQRPAFTLSPTGDQHRVTNIELFYDLVFVFALTQITSMIGADPSGTAFMRGLVILAMIWFAWCAYSWLGNQAQADLGLMRGGMLTALVAMFFVAVAIPRTFDTGRAGALVFLAGYVLVRLAHIAVYLIAAANDPELRAQVLRGFSGCVIALAPWFAGAAMSDVSVRLGLWTLGWAIDFIGVYVTSRNPGWRLNAAPHFAERFALIVLIAIGESLVSIGVGVSSQPITWRLAAAILCGLFVSIALWWLYFDVLASVAEHTLVRLTGVARVKLARDSFTYLHLPIVTGVVLSSLGLKFALGQHHEHDAGAWSLCGGTALYLVTLSALRRRNLGHWNVQRLVVGLLILGLAPVGTHLDGLEQVAIVAALLIGLVTYESIVLRDVRLSAREARLE